MAFNIFEFFDTTIKGIIYFFYSLVQTLISTLLFPRSTPVVLLRLNRDATSYQISALTMLVVLFAADIALFPRIFGESIGEELGAASWSKFLDEGKAPHIALVVIAGAFIGAAIIDATLRAFLVISYGNRPGWQNRRLVFFRRTSRRRQSLRLALLEYSFVLPLASLGVLLKSLDQSFLFPQWLYVVVFLVSAAPSGWWLARLAVRGRRRDPRACKRRQYLWPAFSVVAAFVTFGAYDQAFLATDRINGYSDKPKATLLEVDCYGRTKVTVRMGFANNTDVAVEIDPDEWSVFAFKTVLWASEATEPAKLAFRASADRPALLLAPKQTTVLWADATPPPEDGWKTYDTCAVQGADGSVGGRISDGVVPVMPATAAR